MNKKLETFPRYNEKAIKWLAKINVKHLCQWCLYEDNTYEGVGITPRKILWGGCILGYDGDDPGITWTGKHNVNTVRTCKYFVYKK